MEPTATPGATRPVRVGLLASINELDPRLAVDYVSALILDQVFEPPYTALAGQATPEPRLFELLRSEDGNKGLQYSAAVRPGILFSDGTPLTAELAVRSLRGASVLTRTATMDVRGGRVWFTLSTPNPRFDLTLTQSGCALVFDNGKQLVGTGPYMFEQRPDLRLLKSSSRVRLLRNPNHQGTARVDEIEFQVLTPEDDGTPRALVEALRNGTIDMTTGLSASDLLSWNISGVAPLTKPSNSTAFLYMNTSRPPLNEAKARQGIAAAIDLLEIASKTYDRNPAAFVATAALPPSISRSGGVVRMSSGDAARMIQESGLRGARLKLVVPWAPRPYLLKPMVAAQIIQKRLADVGVTVSVVETTSDDEYFNMLTDGHFDLALGGWIADTIDPADFYDALLSSRTIGNGNFANHSRWGSDATDAMLEQFRIDPSDAHRRRIEQLIADQVPFLPLLYGQSCVVHGRRIRNVTLLPTGSLSLATLTVAG